MQYNRVYNFSSGPAMMPECVLESIRDELMNYHGTGMSVMEMSHRSDEYRSIARETEADLRLLMGIPSDYAVLFIQGGGTLEFSAVPLNLMKTKTAVYIDTGVWSKKAANEATRYGQVIIGASGADRDYHCIPKPEEVEIPSSADYVYICENETINGVQWQTLPNTKGIPLVSDQSSMFLSRVCNVRDYGMIWAGVQKNVGPAGMSIAIINRNLISENLDPSVPLYLRYYIHANASSGYNTPNTWSVYCCGKVIKHLLKNGGIELIQKANEEKATMLYNFLDSSSVFHNDVEKDSRSLMNIPFSTGDIELDAKIVHAAKKEGLYSLSGHPSVGGLRASLYNAMPKEGIEALIGFLGKAENIV